MPRIRSALACFALLGSTIACGDGKRGVSDSEREAFVDTYVALRRAIVRTGAGPAFEEQKKRILAEHHTTEARMKAVALRASRDAGHASELWTEINDRLSAADTVSHADSAKPRPDR